MDQDAANALTDFSTELLDNMSVPAIKQIRDGIKERLSKGDNLKTGYVASKSFVLYLDATDAELQAFGVNLVDVFGDNKAKSVVRKLEAAMALEQRREAYLEQNIE